MADNNIENDYRVEGQFNGRAVPCEDGTGTLTVQVYTANGALPVQGAKVTVSDEGGATLYELYTDRSGRTNRIELCVPLAVNSQNEGNGGSTYGVFNIKVEKQGYYTEAFLNVAVFDGINSIQPVVMEPLGENAVESDKSSRPERGTNEIGGGGSMLENSARIGDALIIREQPRPAVDSQQNGREVL